MRRFQDRVSDPELRAAIRGFIGQEAHHSKEHRVLNDFMEARGVPVSKIDAFSHRALAVDRGRAALAEGDVDAATDPT